MTSLALKFNRLDKLDFQIHQAVMGVAKYFQDEKKLLVLKDYCSLLTDSITWPVKDRVSFLEVQSKKLNQVYSNENIEIEKLVSMLDKAFRFAISKGEYQFNKLRGHLFEAVIIGINGGPAILYPPKNNPKYGWGASITLGTNKSPLIYENENATETRATIDFGSWIKNQGAFYECKIRPQNFGAIEKEYMTYINEVLKEKGYVHSICVLAADTKDVIEMNLVDEEGIPEDLVYLGYDNVVDFVKQQHQV